VTAITKAGNCSVCAAALLLQNRIWPNSIAVIFICVGKILLTIKSTNGLVSVIHYSLNPDILLARSTVIRLSLARTQKSEKPVSCRYPQPMWVNPPLQDSRDAQPGCVNRNYFEVHNLLSKW